MNSSDKQHVVASEAQRLIGVSLAKIAQSRVSRGGVSLHKNLLVATVLQKARYVFMEEAYHIVHGHYPPHSRQFAAAQRHHQQQQHQQQQQLHLHHQQQQQFFHHHQQQQQQLERTKYISQQQQQQQQQLIHHHDQSSLHHRESSAKSSLTKQQPQQTQNHQHQQLQTTYRMNYSRLNHHDSHHADDDDFVHHPNDAQPQDPSTTTHPLPPLSASEIVFDDLLADIADDKENISPPEPSAAPSDLSTSSSPDQLTYLDLDTHNKLLHRPATPSSSSSAETPSSSSPKRRRVISDSETNEAVLSILPKRCRVSDDEDEEEYAESSSSTSSMVSPTSDPDEPMDTFLEDEETPTDLSTAYSSSSAEPMEIDRISSLVSIFGHLSRSAANPVENCATQAHHEQGENLNGGAGGGVGNSAGSLHHQHHSLLAMSV